jgi:hypothetical protein
LCGAIALFLMLFGNSMQGQNGFLCNTDMVNPRIIAASMINVPMMEQNQDFIITGDVIFQSTVDIYNCRFVIAPGVKIRFENETKIIGCRFSACDQMWKGLEMHRTSTFGSIPVLYMQNNIV